MQNCEGILTAFKLSVLSINSSINNVDTSSFARRAVVGVRRGALVHMRNATKTPS